MYGERWWAIGQWPGLLLLTVSYSFMDKHIEVAEICCFLGRRKESGDGGKLSDIPKWQVNKLSVPEAATWHLVGAHVRLIVSILP